MGPPQPGRARRRLTQFSRGSTPGAPALLAGLAGSFGGNPRIPGWAAPRGRPRGLWASRIPGEPRPCGRAALSGGDPRIPGWASSSRGGNPGPRPGPGTGCKPQGPGWARSGGSPPGRRPPPGPHRCRATSGTRLGPVPRGSASPPVTGYRRVPGWAGSSRGVGARGGQAATAPWGPARPALSRAAAKSRPGARRPRTSRTPSPVTVSRPAGPRRSTR